MVLLGFSCGILNVLRFFQNRLLKNKISLIRFLWLVFIFFICNKNPKNFFEQSYCSQNQVVKLGFSKKFSERNRKQSSKKTFKKLVF